MARKPRQYGETGIYHIIIRGNNRQNIFYDDNDRKLFISLLKKYTDALNISVYAYCLMSNHVHIVLKEKSVGDISLIMKRILTKYARWYNIKYGRSGALIANRYKSVPVEIDEYFEVGGRKVKAPGKFGRAEEDINCRCILLTRPRWAVDKKRTKSAKISDEYGKEVSLTEILKKRKKVNKNIQFL